MHLRGVLSYSGAADDLSKVAPVAKSESALDFNSDIIIVFDAGR